MRNDTKRPRTDAQRDQRRAAEERGRFVDLSDPAPRGRRSEPRGRVDGGSARRAPGGASRSSSTSRGSRTPRAPRSGARSSAVGGKRLALVVAALAVVVVVIVALVSCFSSGPSVPPLSHDISAVQTNGQVKSYVSSSGEPSQFGIDVSSHNGQIDWQQVANDPDGVQFAYLRAGWRGYDQGIIQEDPQVRANITGATQAGLGVGLYFFSQAITVDEAREEADYVCDLADEFGLSGYPIVFDLEESNVDVERIGHLTTQERTDIALAFCQRVEDRGYEPMIYSNNHWFTQRYDLPRISHAAKLWYARYGDDPGVDYDFAMWQYDNEGAIQGIDTIVDLDIMFPDE